MSKDKIMQKEPFDDLIAFRINSRVKKEFFQILDKQESNPTLFFRRRIDEFVNNYKKNFLAAGTKKPVW